LFELLEPQRPTPDVLKAANTVLLVELFVIEVTKVAVLSVPRTTSPSTPARTALLLPMALAAHAPMPPKAPASRARRERAFDSGRSIVVMAWPPSKWLTLGSVA
jgi:hypothetical protein